MIGDIRVKRRRRVDTKRLRLLEEVQRRGFDTSDGEWPTDCLEAMVALDLYAEKEKYPANMPECYIRYEDRRLLKEHGDRELFDNSTEAKLHMRRGLRTVPRDAKRYGMEQEMKRLYVKRPGKLTSGYLETPTTNTKGEAMKRRRKPEPTTTEPYFGKNTINRKIEELLLAVGCTRERIGKYVVYVHANMEEKIFLGKNGAFRIGRTRTESRSYTESRDTGITFIMNKIYS